MDLIIHFSGIKKILKMKINEVDLSKFGDKKQIEQSLREQYADVDLETLTNVANSAKSRVESVKGDLMRSVQTANSPFSMQSKRDMNSLVNLMLNIYKHEMTILFTMLREKKRGK